MPSYPRMFQNDEHEEPSFALPYLYGSMVTTIGSGR
jgi:hypothetical protein